MADPLPGTLDEDERLELREMLQRSAILALRSFSNGRRIDLDAVIAGLTLDNNPAQ